MYFDKQNNRFKLDGKFEGQELIIVSDTLQTGKGFISIDGGKNYEEVNDGSFNPDKFDFGFHQLLLKENLENVKEQIKIEQNDGKNYLIFNNFRPENDYSKFTDVRFIFSQNQEFEGVVLEGFEGNQKLHLEFLDIQELKEEIELPNNNSSTLDIDTEELLDKGLKFLHIDKDSYSDNIVYIEEKSGKTDPISHGYTNIDKKGNKKRVSISDITGKKSEEIILFDQNKRYETDKNGIFKEYNLESQNNTTGWEKRDPHLNKENHKNVKVEESGDMLVLSSEVKNGESIDYYTFIFNKEHELKSLSINMVDGSGTLTLVINNISSSIEEVKKPDYYIPAQ